MIPELVDIGEEHLVLPPGRHMTIFDEVKDRYALRGNQSREEIWSWFESFAEMLQDVYSSVGAIWIAGSYVTSKESPTDIDIAVLIKEDIINDSLSTDSGIRLAKAFSREGYTTKNITDGKVDAMLVSVKATTVNEKCQYLLNRGYVDNLWSKARSKTEGLEGYPRCGYLEVIVNGF